MAAAYTNALAGYVHRVSESTRNFAVESANAATPVEAGRAVMSYVMHQYSEAIAFTGRLLTPLPVENDLPIERGCFALGVKEAAS